MKRLYLVRHAKSSWKDATLEDFDRPLNKRGQRDAPFMGKRLKFYKVSPDLIMSSPAKRAAKTAKVIAEEIGFPKKQIVYEDAIYEAGVKSLLRVIREINDSASQVLLFGHNPGLTMLAEYLSDAVIDNIPTCGVFCLDFNVTSWENVEEGKGTIVFFDYPKKHL